jgi:hypothetical protein
MPAMKSSFRRKPSNRDLTALIDDSNRKATWSRVKAGLRRKNGYCSIVTRHLRAYSHAALQISAVSHRQQANDLGAVNLVHGQDFVAGPHLNIYNEATLASFARFGLKRWVPPLEGTRAMIETLHASRPTGVETEVFVYGKLPFAFSARCFTARHFDLNKDDCPFKCLDHAEGLTPKTREEQDFLTINGIQTMSARSYNLLHEIPDMSTISASPPTAVKLRYTDDQQLPASGNRSILCDRLESGDSASSCRAAGAAA